MRRAITLGSLLALAGLATAQEAVDSRGVFELLRQMDSLRQEVKDLRGQLENQAHALEQLKNAQTAGYVDLDRRLQGLAGGAGLPPLPTLEATPGDSVAGTPAPQGDLQVEPVPGAFEAPGEGTVPGLPPGAAAPEAAMPGPGSLPADPGGVPPAAGMPPSAAPGEEVAALGPDGPAPMPPPTTPVPGALGPAVDDASSESAYRDAFGLLKAGEYDQAIAAFSTYLERYPQSQYGDNAQYWLAEAYYVKRAFEPAIAEYRKMLANYPQSKKLSHAMLKIGYSHHELGQPAEARAALQELLQRFPGSAAARLAEERIAQIDAAGGGAGG